MTVKRSPLSDRLTRRTFLGALAIGAMASSASGLLTPGSAIAQRSRSRTPRFVIREDRFGRMFPGLRPFADSSSRLQAVLREIGSPGGIMDARDALAEGPINLIVNPALSANNPDNPRT